MRARQNRWWIFLLLCALLTVLGLTAAQAEGAQISGIVWQDRTLDGKFANEPGLANVKISLEQRTASGETLSLATAQTDREGAFAFAVPQAGEYRLNIQLPGGYQFAPHGLDSSALPARGNSSYTPYFTLQDGDFAEKNIGATKAASYMAFIAFEDLNANGGRMQAEPAIRGVQVELLYEYDDETYVVASGTTDREGALRLENLSAGAYRVRATLPDNFVIGPLGQKINTFYNCILPGEDTSGVSAPFTLEPKGSVGMGIGAVRTGSLSGTIWYDENFNGRWDAGESGLTDAVIALHSDALSLTRETRADAAGAYAFKGLQPGDYQLQITLPEGLIFTYPGTSLLSDATGYGALDASVQVDRDTVVGAVGAMPATALSLMLYQQSQANGAWIYGTDPLPGGSVSVTQEGVTTTLLSDAEERIRFPTLRSGQALLHFQLPDGYVFPADVESLFSAAAGLEQADASIALDGAEAETSLAVWITRAAAIQGTLFEDPSNTGVYHPGDALLSGFGVQAVNAAGQAVLTAYTDENGAYTLSPLAPGEYTVRFLLNDPYIATPYAAQPDALTNHIAAQTPEYGETESVALLPGGLASGLDGGVFRASLVDGYVLQNKNQDELATNEGGLAGVTVTLLDEYGAPYSDYSYGVTDEKGYFLIKGVIPGTYALLYSMPDNAAFTYPMTDETEQESDFFQVPAGAEVHMTEVGGVYTASLAGFVLHNAQEGPSPVPASITLTSHTFGTIYETRSLEDGEYILSGLRPDTYTLDVTLPEAYVFGTGSDLVSPSADHHLTKELAFASGQQWLDADIWASLPAAFSGTVFFDADFSGQMETGESAADGRELALLFNGQIALHITSDAAGVFSADHLVPGKYEVHIPLADNEVIVGHKTEADGTCLIPFTLEDGAQTDDFLIPLMQYAAIDGAVWSLDGTLTGVDGIAVTLLNEKGKTVASAVTDGAGAFAFADVLPGEYTLAASLPKGYLFARSQDALSRSSYIQSLADGTFQPLPFTVPMGESLTGIDIGMGAMGRIGDRAWLDENGNGMQDLNEPDMPGILIELYQHGEFIASTHTDQYGRYSLEGLYPGEYEMRVTMHAELKPTLRQTEFPLVASVMPESNDTTVSVPGVIVPSGGANLHYDLGFQLRKKGVYPSVMKEIPTKDWTPYSQR